MLALMGHMSRAMLERYSQIRMAAKRTAIESLTLTPSVEVVESVTGAAFPDVLIQFKGEPRALCVVLSVSDNATQGHLPSGREEKCHFLAY